MSQGVLPAKLISVRPRFNRLPALTYNFLPKDRRRYITRLHGDVRVFLIGYGNAADARGGTSV
jgi:hypothetical protein